MHTNFKTVIKILKKQKSIHVIEKNDTAKAIYYKHKAAHVLHIDKNGYINDTPPKQFFQEIKEYGW